MDQHDRIGVRLLLRNLELDVNLADHRAVAFVLHVFAADVEIALLRDHKRLVSGADRAGRAAECAGRERKRDGQVPAATCK
jgi:hypothetical protein